MNENRPLPDETRQACDQRRPENDKQQDERDSDEGPKGRGGRARHGAGHNSALSASLYLCPSGAQKARNVAATASLAARPLDQ